VEEQGGDWAAAENHYRRGLELQARLVEEVPASSRYRHHLAMVHGSLGALLYAKGEAATGTSHLRQSIALWSAPAGEPATQDVEHGLSADALNRLAWLLANCPDPQLRDLDRAVKLARSAVGCAPRQAEFWATLGIAYYRTGDAGAAQEALERADRHGQDRDPADGFFLAMIYWLQGDQPRGRQEYDRAAQSMEVHQPGSEALRRFRAEAAALLGLAKPPDRTPTTP
jgi:tetratricopeptide (TPR) repeat protein